MKAILTFVIFITLVFASAAGPLLDPWQKTVQKDGVRSMDVVVPVEQVEIVKTIKDNMIYFRDHDRCFAAVAYRSYYGFNLVSITQVTCGEDIK
jgi:hypothetical protein